MGGCRRDQRDPGAASVQPAAGESLEEEAGVHGLWSMDAHWALALAGHPAWLRPAAVSLLHLSRAGALWLVLFALFFLIGGRRGRRIAITGAVAVLLAHALAVWGLQGLFQRAGPAQTLPGLHILSVPQPPFSFPAERTAQAFAAAPFLTRGTGAGPAVVWTLVGAVAWADAFSGLYFPTDVLAGAAVGVGSAMVAMWLLGDPFHRPRGHLLPLPGRQRPGLQRR